MAHVCEPETYPTSLDEQWDCPECGYHYIAFSVRDDALMAGLSEAIRSHLRDDTLGWKIATN